MPCRSRHFGVFFWVVFAHERVVRRVAGALAGRRRLGGGDPRGAV